MCSDVRVLSKKKKRVEKVEAARSGLECGSNGGSYRLNNETQSGVLIGAAIVQDNKRCPFPWYCGSTNGVGWWACADGERQVLFPISRPEGRFPFSAEL